MAASSAALGAGLLVAAGVWQFTPMKDACLRKCASPARFLAEHWRPGARGAARMGVVHGAFCIGCCWVLMLLLFYGGVMNLYWIGTLTALILVEKLVPAARWVGRFTGAVLILWGGAVALSFT
jgi:predicted metal-binding membrane protein